jgi:5-methylcytosine-specific restriction enzyme A
MTAPSVEHAAAGVSTQRFRKGASGKTPPGPNGRPTCRQCGVEVPKGHRTFCGEDCVHLWRMQTSPSYLRAQVYKRDRGVCALCGVDTARLGRVIGTEWKRVKLAVTTQQRRERAEFRQEFRWYFRRTSYWDADHIIPVVEGGGQCTLENMRTLCIPCHQRATKELARRRASHRRQERRRETGHT